LETAQHQLDILLDLTLCGVGVHRRFHGTAGVERKVVVEGLSANRGEVDPNIGLVDRIDRVGEVDLVHTSVDAVVLGRNLERDTRILGRSVAPAFLIPTTGVDRHIVGICRTDTGHRPNVDSVRALVRDDSFGACKSYKGTDHENAAGHDDDGAGRTGRGRQ
jgi:hypothetical protein